MNILIWTLTIGIALFQLVDYWTTKKTLEHSGVELNKMLCWLMLRIGTEATLIITKSMAAILVFVGAVRGWWESEIGISVLTVLFVLYAVVVVNNISVYRKR